jgi:hypothetical protein
VKVLIIGASDTLGTYLPDPTQGTFPILARELPAALRAEVEVSHMRFYSHFKNAPQHALTNVRQRAPDITVVAAHSMAFTAPSVSGRLVHIFGWKTGRWLERRIWDFDARARRGGVAARLRKPAQKVAHRTVGVAPYASVKDTIGHYTETIGLLSRIEEMQLLVLGTFQPRRDGELAPHARLNAGLAAATTARRIDWIDRQAIVTSLGEAAFQPNGRYSTPLVHRAVADAVIAALAR